MSRRAVLSGARHRQQRPPSTPTRTGPMERCYQTGDRAARARHELAARGLASFRGEHRPRRRRGSLGNSAFAARRAQRKRDCDWNAAQIHGIEGEQPRRPSASTASETTKTTRETRPPTPRLVIRASPRARHRPAPLGRARRGRGDCRVRWRASPDLRARACAAFRGRGSGAAACVARRGPRRAR